MAREWDELIESSNQRSYFMRWRWNYLWWSHLAPADAELRIVECRDDAGRLVGLAPLYLRRRRAFRIIPIRELVFLGTGVRLKTSDHLNVVTRCGYEESASQSMAAALAERDDWDRLSCSRVPADSTALPHFVASLKDTSTLSPFERAPFVDTSIGWSAYKQTLGRSMRRNVEYYARRLFKRYRCEFERVQTKSEIQAALSTLVRLHIEQWRSRGEIGSLSNTTFQRFLHEVASDSFDEDRLRVWTIKIEGRVEGVLLGFFDGGVLHYFQTGYNPAFSNEDLGTALVSLCIRDCCDDPRIDAFDFMGGGAEYKLLWARQARHTILGEVSRKTLPARAFVLQHRLETIATALYRAVTPSSIRDIRRDWLRARAMREELHRLAQQDTGVIAAVSACVNFEWISTCAESTLPVIAGLASLV
jgi:CelD/BcsL family acetyltransferase involved in cellulose biosynthesis